MAGSFDRQVAERMGDFHYGSFLPTTKKTVKVSLSQDEVKRLEDPDDLGAKIGGVEFQERLRHTLSRRWGSRLRCRSS